MATRRKSYRATFPARRIRLRQSVLKLLSNAARITFGVTVSAAQRRRNDGDWIGIAAPNSAIGIPAGKLD